MVRNIHQADCGSLAFPNFGLEHQPLAVAR